MWYVVEKVSFKLIMSAIVLSAASGCGQPGGNAPGAGLDQAPLTTPQSAVMKYGESVTTAGGWTVSIDNSDPVQNSTLSNGWSVEVLDE
jgi:hypothetical protein